MHNATIDAAIAIAFVMTGCTINALSVTVGNVDTFYEVQNSNNYVDDTGATFGTASVYEIGLSGTLNRNGAVITGTSVTFPRTTITGNSLQRISSATDSVFITGTGLDTKVQDNALSAAGFAGLIVDSAAGAASAPVSLAVGATNAWLHGLRRLP